MTMKYLNFCFMYIPKMTKKDVYTYFLIDFKSENKHHISENFYNSLDYLEKEYVKLDMKSYRDLKTNNLYRFVCKFNCSEGSAKYLKSKIIQRLYNFYKEYLALRKSNG